MWLAKFIYVALVGFTLATEGFFKINYEYLYNIRGRTLTGLAGVSNQYSGLLIKGNINIQRHPDTSNGTSSLVAKVSDLLYTKVHENLSGGWDTWMPFSTASWRPLEISQEPFLIYLKDGLIADIAVHQEMPNWEANLLKSFVSQFQVNTNGTGYGQESTGKVPDQIEFETFKVMEQTITGEFETLYSINPLPKYIIQSQPWLAPLANGKELIEIVKTKNYSRTDNRPGYHFGWSSTGAFKPATTHMGDFFSRSSVSKIVLSKSSSDLVLQSSLTINKNAINPTLNNKEKGLIVSKIKATLIRYKNIDTPFKVQNLKRLGNIIYAYDIPFAHEHTARSAIRASKSLNILPMSSSSPSSSSSSTESNNSIRKNKFNDSSESSSVSSSENVWLNPESSLEIPPQIPLLPLFVGYKGQPVKAAQTFNAEHKSVELLKLISAGQKDPEKIPDQSILLKYNLLVSLFRTMSLNELRNVANQVYTRDNFGEKHDVWSTFTDAVSETGTGPTLLLVYDFIVQRKIESHIAATVVSSLVENVRVPTFDFILKLFELLKLDQLQHDFTAMVSTTLGFSRLLRKVYVDGEASRNEYPVHVFGPFNTKKGEMFVENEYIPYLNGKIQDAIKNANDVQVLVYIRALGYLGHKGILNVFKPYLGGFKNCSRFQRLQMVAALDKLSQIQPKLAREVLFRIYQNRGETQEVRVAAVFQLMRTIPPANMLQLMAENTHSDVHEHVNSAVKYAIDSASSLEGNRYYILRSNARAAQPMLTEKNYGIQYSHNILKTYIDEKIGVMYKSILKSIGSEDSYMPKAFGYKLLVHLAGMQRHLFDSQAMVSSLFDFKDLLRRQNSDQMRILEKQKEYHTLAENFAWSSEQISKLLGIENNQDEAVEGSYWYKFGQTHNMFGFNNRSLEKIPEILGIMQAFLKETKEFSMSKMMNSFEVAISYPTEMSFPLLYTYDVPTYYSIKGKARMEFLPDIVFNKKIKMPDSIKGDFETELVMAAAVRDQLTFISQFDHQEYSAGYDKFVQVYTPFSMNFDYQSKLNQMEMELRPLLPDKSTKVLTYATRPYTSQFDVLELYAPQGSPSTKVIPNSREVHKSISFGQNYGMAFKVDYTAGIPFLDKNWMVNQVIRKKGMISFLNAPFFDDSIFKSHLRLAYDSERSPSTKIKIHMGHLFQYQEKAPTNDLSITDIKQFSNLPERQSRHRQEMMLQWASKGIDSAETYACDFSVEFEGQPTIEYTLSVAISASKVTPTQRTLFFFRKFSNGKDIKPYQVGVSIKSLKSQVSHLDLEYALSYDSPVETEMLVGFGSDFTTQNQLKIKSVAYRSKDRVDYIRHLPESIQCMNFFKHSNPQSTSCANLTEEANILNQYILRVKYDNVDSYTRNLTRKVFRFTQRMLFWNLDENEEDAQGNTDPNEIKFAGKLYPQLDAMNLTITTENMVAAFSNIRLGTVSRQMFIDHPQYSFRTRVVGQNMEGGTYMPTCSMGESEVSTFDNMTIPIQLHREKASVLIHYLPKNPTLNGQILSVPERQREQFEQYSILAKSSSIGHNNKDVIISLRTYQTGSRPIRIELSPKENPSDKTMITIHSVEKTYKIELNETRVSSIIHAFPNYIQAYLVKNEEIKVDVRDVFEVVYKNGILKITAVSDKLRGSTQGLCGTFDGQMYNDLLTPQNCIVRDPLVFSQRYLVDKSGSLGMKADSRNENCYPVENIYHDVVTEGPKPSNPETPQDPSEPINDCTLFKIITLNGDGRICFSKHPQPECRPGCIASEIIKKNVEMYCAAQSRVSRLWAQHAERGLIPGVVKNKAPNNNLELQLPHNCVRNE